MDNIWIECPRNRGRVTEFHRCPLGPWIQPCLKPSSRLVHHGAATISLCTTILAIFLIYYRLPDKAPLKRWYLCKDQREWAVCVWGKNIPNRGNKCKNPEVAGGGNSGSRRKGAHVAEVGWAGLKARSRWAQSDHGEQGLGESFEGLWLLLWVKGWSTGVGNSWAEEWHHFTYRLEQAHSDCWVLNRLKGQEEKGEEWKISPEDNLEPVCERSRMPNSRLG